MDVEVSVAVPGDARVGEGPYWDAEAGRLHWVDILRGRIHSSGLDAADHQVIEVPTLVGAAVPKVSGGYVAATAEGFAEVGHDGTWTTRVDLLPSTQRMNDAKCDHAGRFWAGSTDMDFAPGHGALHVLTPSWRWEQVLDGLTLPNGLEWSLDGHTFYLVDTIAGELSAFDAPSSGLTPTNRRLLARFPSRDGIPDGMTIDADGCLWIAMWGGGRIVRLSPDGEILATVPVPVAQPSSCAFAGPDVDVLVVTTAREGLDLAEDDVAGSVLVVRGLGVRGLPSRPFAG